jgi:parvulin-like peptidyl-prolyl isomerase
MTKDYQPELTGEEEAACNVREIHQIFVAEGDISHLGKNKDQEQLAASLLKRVQNGEDFDVLADRYSSEGNQPVVVLNDKGYAFDADAWVDETFLAEALKLEAGKISGVFKTEFGWHVIYCAGIGEPDLCEEARAALIGQKKQNYFADLLKTDLSEVVVTEGDGWPYIGVLTF